MQYKYMMREVSTKLTMHRNGTFSISGCIMLKKVWPFGFLWHESFTRLQLFKNNGDDFNEADSALLCQHEPGSFNQTTSSSVRRLWLLHTSDLCDSSCCIRQNNSCSVMWRWCWSRVTLSLTGATWEHRLHIWCHVAAQRDSVQVRSKGCWV